MRQLRPILLLLAIAATAGTALAQCPDLIEADCGGGWAWFGLRHDGANVGQGHTLTLPCDGAPLSMEFQFRVTGNPNGGVPSMVTGDAINVVLMDMDDNHLMTATSTIPADVFEGWIDFEFPEDMTVPAGMYRVVAYTTVPRQCSFAFCYQQDVYDGGARTASLDGIAGPWFEYGDDAPFRFHVNSDSVPTRDRSFSSMKGMFR
jgi:hypothetical protein